LKTVVVNSYRGFKSHRFLHENPNIHCWGFLIAIDVAGNTL
jgi:hypothetical protein